MSLTTRHDRRHVALTAFSIILSSCGSLTAGGVGEVTVTLTGDDPANAMALTTLTAHPGYSQSPAYSAVVAPSDHDDDDPEGQLEADFELYLEAEGGERIHLTPDGQIEVKVDLEGVETNEVVSQVVGAARYTGLQMVFVKIEAEVDAGLIINGVPFTGAVKVDLGDEDLTVTRALDLTIEADATVFLDIDLNAADWLQALDPESATIAAQAFADLVTVTVR